jgi:hypothetical protein
MHKLLWKAVDGPRGRNGGCEGLYERRLST